MERWIKMSKWFNRILGVVTVGLLTWGAVALIESAVAAGGSDTNVTAQTQHTGPAPVASEVSADAQAKVQYWAFMAAALATGIGSLAAGYAVGNVGTAALAAVAEKPELMGKSLIYVALAEGIAIYGLLISIIILAKV